MVGKRGVGPVLAFVLAAPLAWADGRLDPKTCTTAAAYGQQLRNDGRLRAALDAYKTCSEQQCAEAVRSECTKAHEAVEASTPSVIVIVRDAAGRDSTNVAVVVDGQLAAQESTGLLVDPGMHTFRVEGFDGVPSEQRVLVHEGEKNRTLLFTRTNASAPTSMATSTAPAQEARHHTAWPWLVIGSGAASVLVGAVMIGTGWAIWDAGHTSDNGTLSLTNASLAQAGAVVNHTGIGLTIGGAVVAGIGLAWHFLEPAGAAAKTVALSPLFGPGVGGGSVRVTF